MMDKSKNISLLNTNVPGDMPNARDVAHHVTYIVVDRA